MDYYVQKYNISGYNIMIQIFSKFLDQIRSSHLTEQCGPTYRTLTMYNSLSTYIYPCKHAFFWCIKRCAITCFGFLLTFFYCSLFQPFKTQRKSYKTSIKHPITYLLQFSGTSIPKMSPTSKFCHQHENCHQL